MFKIISFFLVSLMGLIIICCSSNAPKLITQQKVGDKVVMLLSSTGTIPKGTGSFYIEFHEASDNIYYDVGKIEADAKMQMAGNPMIGELNIIKTEIPGRY